MTPNLTAAAWLKAVMRSDLSDSTKVVMAVYADHVRRDLRVSVPTTTIARTARKSTRTVDRAISEAYRKHWLDSIEHGQRHRTATYQVMVPVGLSPTVRNGLRPATSVGLRKAVAEKKRSTTGSADSQSDRTGGPVVGTNPSPAAAASRAGGDKRSNEERAGHGSFSELTVCEWHGFTACDDDCANHPDNRKRPA